MRHIKNDENYDKCGSFNTEITQPQSLDMQMTVFSNSPKGLEQLITAMKRHIDHKNLFLNLKKIKSKIVSVDKTKCSPKIIIDNDEIESFVNFF